MGARRELAPLDAERTVRLSELPPTALATVAKMAATGWSEKAIARALGCDFKTWKRLLSDEPLLADAYDQGRETEHQELYSLMMKAARKPGRIGERACEFLLRTRHGYGADQEAAAGLVAFIIPKLSPEEREALLEARRQRMLPQGPTIECEPRETNGAGSAAAWRAVGGQR
jgi:hypothetical protein